MFKILLILVQLLLATGLIIDESSKLINNETEINQSRSIEKSANLVLQLYKMFNSAKEAPKPQQNFEIVPYDGLGIFKRKKTHGNLEKFDTLAHLKKQIRIVDKKMGEKNNSEPEFWFFDKFSNKIDLVWMTKILLKLIVFKKVVKFIALICLLFFLPALKDNTTSVDEDSRNLDPYGNILINFVINFI